MSVRSTGKRYRILYYDTVTIGGKEASAVTALKEFYVVENPATLLFEYREVAELIDLLLKYLKHGSTRKVTEMFTDVAFMLRGPRSIFIASEVERGLNALDRWVAIGRTRRARFWRVIDAWAETKKRNLGDER